MKKIAIVTTHWANNFGALLQAYALVEACRKLGADAEILDWRCRAFERYYHTAWLPGKHFLISLMRWVWFWTVELSVRRKFDAFRKLIATSSICKDRADLESRDVRYDSFIVGSDQVWNPANTATVGGLSTFDRACLLDFVKTKPKNAYAASIGVSRIAPSSLEPEFVEAWKSFDCISMREQEGAEYVERLTGRHVESVLDPTLLFDATFWTRFVAPKSSGRTVFRYDIKRVPVLRDFSEEVADKLGAKIISPLIPAHTMLDPLWAPKFGPIEFVSAIANSECVVASSFHAAAFSLIFGKRLYLVRRQVSSSPNTRFDELMRISGVKEEIVRQIGDQVISLIDFSKADPSAVAVARAHSWSFLKRIINDERAVKPQMK